MRAVMTMPAGARWYEAALEGLARLGEAVYRDDPTAPSIYDGGVRYRREPRETWRHARQVLTEGWGDCEDLAAARVGELRARGIDPAARVEVYYSAPRVAHAVVRRGDGRIEDPSRRLGMGDRTTSESEWEEIGTDASGATEVSWTVDRTPSGWRGVVRVPLTGGRVLRVARTGSSRTSAARAAVAAASKALDAASGALPPPARFALNLARSAKARKAARAILDLF